MYHWSGGREKRERRGREEGEKRERRGREEGEKRERRGREEGEKREGEKRWGGGGLAQAYLS
jgi:hypothetical protein